MGIQVLDEEEFAGQSGVKFTTSEIPWSLKCGKIGRRLGVSASGHKLDRPVMVAETNLMAEWSRNIEVEISHRPVA